MKYLILCFLSISTALTVQGQHDHANMKMDADEIKKFVVSSVFKDQLNEVYSRSLNLTESLISGESGVAQSSASEVKEAVGKVDMSLLDESEAHMTWMMNLNDLNSALVKIESVDDIDKQREAYATFSQALYRSIKAFGATDTIYYQHCPMALGNEGAYWLSAVAEIRNPYFGSSMLTCGSTKETLN